MCVCVRERDTVTVVCVRERESQGVRGSQGCACVKRACNQPHSISFHETRIPLIFVFSGVPTWEAMVQSSHAPQATRGLR